MLISEHTTGLEVLVTAQMNGNSRGFKTTIIGELPATHSLYKYVILCEVMTHEDKVLDFTGAVCNVSIKGADGRVYRYPRSKVMALKVDNVSYHLIANANDVKPINQREAYRYPISCEALIRPKSNHGTVSGFIRDISQTGIAFTVNENNTYVPHVGDECHLSFMYTGVKYSITCTVVRIQNTDDNIDTVIIGATLLQYTQPVQQLIARLQMQEARLRRESMLK